MKKNSRLTVHRPNRPVSQKIIPAVLAACVLLVGVCGYGNAFFPDLLNSRKSNLHPAQFPHEDHMDFLECLDCHHNYKNGTNELDEDQLYEGNPDIQCSACHNGKKAFPFLRAFHRQCIQCHDTEGQGPVVCGECHTKKKGHK